MVRTAGTRTGLQRAAVTAVALLLTVVGAACGDHSDGGAADALNRYIQGFPELAAAPGSDNPTGPSTTSTEVVDQVKYQCQTTPKTLAANPDDIIALNADAGKLWLGALLQGSGYAGGPGSLAELPIRDRAKLTIFVDLAGKHISKAVAAPTGATVQQSINDLVADAQKAGIQPPAAYSYTSDEAQSAEEALLNAGISVKYLGAKASASLGISHTAGQSSLLVTITQRMFTVKMVKPASPAGYFGPKYRLKDLKEQESAGRISPTNPPVVVSQIVYGRKLIYTVTAKSSADELKAAVSAAYDGGALSGSVQVDAKKQAVLNSAHYSVVAVGGEEGVARSLIATHKIGDYLAGANLLGSAVPISYQVDNVVKDSAAAFSETTNYNLTTCSVVPVQKVLVGAVVKIDALRGYVEGPCKNPALYGDLYLNGKSVWHTTDAKPYSGPAVLGPFDFPGLITPTGSQPPAKYGQTLQPGEFALFSTAGSNALTFSGNINQSVWIGDYPVNLYDATVPYPVEYGEHTIEGNSVHCKVDLKFNLIHVADLYDDAP